MKIKKCLLGDISNISTGLVVKRKEAESTLSDVYKYKMLTLKSFESDGWLNVNELEEFYSGEVLDPKYLTQQGDVLFRLSRPNTAIAINEENQNILIQSLFAVIRLESNIIHPEYLAMFLNSSPMKPYYNKMSIGSTIFIIKTSMIRDIEVHIPPMEYQKKVVDVHSMIIKEKLILSKLVDAKNLYYKGVSDKLIRDGLAKD